MRPKHKIEHGNRYARWVEFGVMFDECKGEIEFSSRLADSFYLEDLLFDDLSLKRPNDSTAQKSGIHMKTHYRYVLPCDRTQYRNITKNLESLGFTLKPTTKLWRK